MAASPVDTRNAGSSYSSLCVSLSEQRLKHRLSSTTLGWHLGRRTKILKVSVGAVELQNIEKGRKPWNVSNPL